MKHRTAESREEYAEKRNLVNTVGRTAKCECWEKLGETGAGYARLYKLDGMIWRRAIAKVTETATAIEDESGNLRSTRD